MQTCKNCQSTLSNDAQVCPFCGSPVQKDNDDARRQLLLRLRLGTLPVPLAATASAAPYVIASTLILGFVIVGLFLRPPAIRSTTLVVTPLTLDFGMVVVGDTQTQALTVKNSSDLPLHWTAERSKASWLRLDTSSGDLGPKTQKIVRATLDAHGLSSGPVPYSVIISFDAGETSTLVKTTATVIAPGKLCVRPDHLNFGTLEQGTTGKIFVTVGDCGSQPLSWFIGAGKENWVSLSSTRGIIEPGGQQMVQVTVDTIHLTPSSTVYATSLTFGSDKGSQIVPITVTVSSQTPPPPPVPTWSVAPTHLDPDNSKCVRKGSIWSCTVMLTENASSQGNINWSPTSNLGASFNPPGGSLMPGGQQQVTISSIICQKDTFTFYGAEGETPIMISWSCTPSCIKVDQPSLSITDMQGQPSKAQSVTFTNCGADMGIVSVLPTTTDGASWLNVSSVNTSTLSGPLAPGMGLTVSISVTSTNLQPGAYQGTITASITTSSGTNTATTTVTLTVSPCFTVDKSSLSLTFPGEKEIQEVTFTNCGTYAGNVSISSSTSDGANWLSIDDYKSQTISGPLAAGETDKIYFYVSGSGLAPTVYQGTISANFTTNGIAASAPVSVTLAVLSAPHMTVTSLDFGSVQQGQTASRPLTIGNTGEQALSWNVQTGYAGWAIPDTSRGTIPGNSGQTIQVKVDTSNLKAGTDTYTTTLTFNSNADNSPVQVKITLVVTPPPIIKLNPTSLSFGTCPSDPLSQDMTITNTGGGTLIWTAGTPTYSYQGTPTSSASWLTVTLTSGSNSDTSGQFSTLTFTIDKEASGDATVVITTADGQTATVKVSVFACIP
jgi:Viral BACON domain